jgi:cytochrome c-type biogenesis protein CcmF
MTTLGNVLLALSVIGALFSIVALWAGDRMGRREGEGATNVGYLATFAVLTTTTLSTLVLLAGFFRSDFTMRYVAENHSTDVSALSWLYKISAVWAGREGSLLFWAWLLSMFAAYVAWRRIGVTDRISNVGLLITNVVQMFFLTALFIPVNNPFQVTPGDWLVNGQLVSQTAMNPLLQHWAMILHPPTLFIGYAGLTIPFAFALAALIINDPSKRWVEIVDRITVFAWLFLGIGIGLGAIWAYVVLGWGGFWAWDPVENASLLPWLTGVGLIHSFTVYRRREGFKKWAVSMAAITFTLVILGTFITRSGVIKSVHAFAPDMWSLVLFLTMMVLPVLAVFGGLALRSKEFESADHWESLTAKESAYYFNNVLMLFAALFVAGLTVIPGLLGMSVGPATYDLLARPIGILYVAILVVCPILSWKATEGSVFWSRFRWPLILGVILDVVFLAIWATVMLPNYTPNPSRLASLKGFASVLPAIDHTEAVVGLVVAGLAVALPLFLFFDGARRRSASKGEGFLTSLGNIIFKARTQSGGYITHLGIGVVLLGLVGSTMYVKDVQFNLAEKPGSSANVGAYTFVYKSSKDTRLANGDQETQLLVDVKRGGQTLYTASPGIMFFANRPEDQSRKLEADVRSEVLRDIFLVFQGSSGTGLSFDVKINPMISWAWFGFALTVLGSAIAAWPKKRPHLDVAPAPPRKKKAR